MLPQNKLLNEDRYPNWKLDRAFTYFLLNYSIISLKTIIMTRTEEIDLKVRLKTATAEEIFELQRLQEEKLYTVKDLKDAIKWSAHMTLHDGWGGDFMYDCSKNKNILLIIILGLN